MDSVPRLRQPKTSLSIGGATYDLFLTMERGTAKNDGIILPVGGKLPVSNIVETTGGGACNTAVGLSRLGLRASFCGIIGSDQWGEKLLQSMLNEQVNVSPATVVNGETSSFSIVMSLPGGDRTILYSAGVNGHLNDVTFDVEAIPGADVVYLNHLADTSCEIEDDVIRSVTEHSGVHVSWNPGGNQISAGIDSPVTLALLSTTTILFLNKEEALTFTRSQSVDEAFKKLEQTGVRIICVTDGKNGAEGTMNGKRYHCPILTNGNVVDTTGAGDAFGTGVTWAISSGATLPIALVAGTLNAASVVGSIGAQAGLLTETQIREKLSHCPLRVSEIDPIR